VQARGGHYGVGARLDQQPELFFRLRQDGADLIAAATSGRVTQAAVDPTTALAEADLGSVFGIELDQTPVAAKGKVKPKAKGPAKKSAERARPRPSTP